MINQADSEPDSGAAKTAESALVVSLEDSAARNRDLVGGKAASLAELVQAQMPVPPGFCVTTEAYRSVMRHNDIESMRETDEAVTKVGTLFESAELPAELEQSIKTAYEKLCGSERCPVAVRSSAVDEDQSDASFAGQYRTTLGITEWDGLLEAIRGCWASLYSEPALAYRRSRCANGNLEIAVVVQRLIDAEVSGVAFSHDPATGKEVVLVDASWGLGEAVVSGWVTPDHYRLDRSGALLDSEIAVKRVRTSADNPGERVSVPEEIAAEPCLSAENLRKLTELTLLAEERAGEPQDVEFALADGRLWLLQSRPITTIAPEPLLEPGMHPRPTDRWTRALADEYLADAVTPLSFSSLGSWIDRDTTKALDRIMGFNEVDPDRPTLRLYRSHAYWNADVVATAFKYVPASARTDTLLAWFPPEMRQQVVTVPTAWRKRLWGELLMRLRDRTSSIRRNHRALEAHARRIAEACVQLDLTDLDLAGKAEVDRYWQSVDLLGREHFRIIRWGMQQHSVTFNFLLVKLLQDWLEDDGRLFSTLIGSDDENLTLRTNYRIWQLARLAENEPAVLELLGQVGAPPLEVGGNPSSPRFGELTDREGDGDFSKQLRCFLDDYGHRGFTRDIGLPRWSDHPDAVLFLIAQSLGSVQDPKRRAEEERAKRESAEREVRKKLGSGLRGFKRRLILGRLLPLARTYTAFRENQRFTLDRILLRIRRAALAYGRLLTDRSLMNDAGEVFYLTLDEVRRALDGDLVQVRHLIDVRRQAYRSDCNMLPPKYLQGDTVIDEGIGDDETNALNGMPVSGGRVTARCHVATRLEDAEGLEPGEVLVASNIDPGWTPLLVKLGGLVLETGGVLAHGAIVAREYGIPAVTAVPNATHRVKDGEWITVDGWAGTVECHGDDPPVGVGTVATGSSN